MVDLLAALFPKEEPARGYYDMYGPLTFEGGWGIPVPIPHQSMTGEQERMTGDFAGYVQGGLQQSAVVYAIELLRTAVFAEARIMYRRLNRGRPGELFHTTSLNIMDAPSPGQTTGSFMSRALLDADLAGNNFAVRLNGKIKRLRPDWITIVLGGSDADLEPAEDPDAEVVGYLYHPQGNRSREPIPYLAEQVAHWAPMPDPLASYRGMSWLTPVVREILADRQATAHKQKFFENGATPNMIIKHQIADVDTMAKWKALFEDAHQGVANAYKTLHLGAGADVTVVGKDFQQIDFKSVQGAGETRIAAASGVGAVMAQFSEGMAGSSLNAGNYAAARRRVADAVFRPLWRSFCGAYSQILTVPRGAQLWFDDRDIAFLREDEKDAADIQFRRSQTIRNLLDAGYEAVSVVDSVENDDMSLLVHTGLFSVQLQRPGTTASADDAPAEPAPNDEEESDV